MLKCIECVLSKNDSICKVAVNYYDSLLSLNNDCRISIYKADVMYYYLDDPLGAYMLLKEAELCKNDLFLIELQGHVCYSLKNYIEAIEYLTKTISKKKNVSATTYFQRAKCFLHQNKLQLALKDLNTALIISPSYHEIRYMRILSNYMLKNYQSILSDISLLEKSINSSSYYPSDSTLMYLQYYKAIALCAKKNFHEAIIQLTKFNSDKHHEVLLTLRAFAKNQMKDYVGAIADCNQAEQIDNTKSDIFSHRGVSYLSLKNYESAIIDFDKAIELSNSTDKNTFFPILSTQKLYQATLYMNRGFAKLALEEYEDACLDWSRAGELGEKDAYKYIRKYCKDLYDEDSEYKNDE